MAITFGAETLGVKNKYIEALLREGMNTGPIQSPWQGASRLAHALLGGAELREAEEERKAGPAEIAALLKSLSGGGGAVANPAMAPASPTQSAAPPLAPPDNTPIRPTPVPTTRVAGPGAPAGRVASAFAALPGVEPPVTGPRPGGPVMPSDKVWGDAEAEAAGLYPPTNGAGAPTAAPVPPSPGITSGPRPQLAQYAPTAPQAPPPPMAPPSGPGSNLTLPQLSEMFATAKTPQAKQFLFGLINERLKQPQYKSVVIGDRGYVFDERTGKYVEGPNAAKQTDLERNLASENKARAERGLPPLSPLEYEREKESLQAQGKGQGEAQTSLPQAQGRMETALRAVSELRNHPGRLHGFSSLAAPYLKGTPQYDFVTRVDQIKGGAFLQAFEMLKGGGQITQVEGDKATAAIARMDRATSMADFDAALNDFERAVRDGFTKLQLKATGQGRAPTTAASGGGSDPLGIR